MVFIHPVINPKSQRGWCVVFVAVVAVAYLAYWYGGRQGENSRVFGHSGGSVLGLTFGALAALLLVVSALRRWLPAGSDWARRGHYWLGALVVPLAWMHGGFHHGGALTSASMWLLYGVVASGFMGSLLGHFLYEPREGEEGDETVLAGLRAEAEDAVAVCGPIDGGDVEQWRTERMRAIHSRELIGGAASDKREALLASVASAPLPRSEPLRELYTESVRRYLSGDDGGTSLLADRARAGQVLRRYRAMLPDELHGVVAKLETICDGCRRVRARRKIENWVQGWMAVHVPLTVALVILAVLHAVFALRY